MTIAELMIAMEALHEISDRINGKTGTTMNAESAKLILKGSRLIEEDAAESQRLISEGLVLQPLIKEGWFNLGLALHQQGKINEAIRSYRKALEIGGNEFNEAANNLAQDLLLVGCWKEGWQLYEKRTNRMKKTFKIYYDMFGEQWAGFSETRKCDELIIVAEQGLGDTLQFCRLLDYLREKGINYKLFCQEGLAPLLKHSGNIKEVITSITKTRENTLWCALMSIPLKIGLEQHMLDEQGSYVTARDEDIYKWKRILRRKEGHKMIGLHWQGNPKFEQRIYTKNRSMKLKDFNSLSEIKGVEFLSLQKGFGSEQIKDANINFVEGQKEFDKTYNFFDTSGAIMNCDLVISADSSMVHLAGALGKKVWIALSKVPEWRWGLGTEKTPWYKGTTLYRQHTSGEWKEVITKMKTDIIENRI